MILPYTLVPKAPGLIQSPMKTKVSRAQHFAVGAVGARASNPPRHGLLASLAFDAAYTSSIKLHVLGAEPMSASSSRSYDSPQAAAASSLQLFQGEGQRLDPTDLT